MDTVNIVLVLILLILMINLSNRKIKWSFYLVGKENKEWTWTISKIIIKEQL